MGPESAFVDLRRLADWFASLPSQPHRGLSIERIVVRLGATCVPLLGRELGAPNAKRREAARVALAQLAAQATARPRVIAELRRIAASNACDDGKVCALGLLAELVIRTYHESQSKPVYVVRERKNFEEQTPP